MGHGKVARVIPQADTSKQIPAPRLHPQELFVLPVKNLIAVSLLVYLFTLFLPAFVRANPHQYEIMATYDESNHLIRGTEKIVFTNTGEIALSEIYLFLYPNRYLEDPKWDRDAYRKVYLAQFNPGSMEILSIQDAEGNPIPVVSISKIKTIQEIRLDKPVPPGASFEFNIKFVTQIPERFGVFGTFRDWVTLQGGWHPYLPSLINGKWDLHAPPSPSQFHVELTLPKSFHVAASTVYLKEDQDATQKIVFGAATLPFFSLSLGKEVIHEEIKVDGVTLSYTGPIQNQKYGKQVLNAAEQAASFFLLEWGSLPVMELQLTHAYLHQDLVTTGTKLLFVDSKLFKVLRPLKRFHEMRIAKGVFLLLLQEQLPWEEPWALETMVGLLVNRFAKSRHPKGGDLKSWLSPVAFFPFIDQVLYSKKVLFRQVYFDESAIDTETISSFNQPARLGVLGSTRLKKQLGGQKLDQAFTHYKNQLGGGEPLRFADTIAHLYPETAPLVEKRHWTFPPVDFGIERVKKKKVETGHQTIVHLKKEGAESEPVKLVLHEKSGRAIPLLWNGEGERYETSMITASPISAVILDPEGKTSDHKQENNRHPKPWKTLLNRYQLGYDLTTDFLRYEVGLLFQPVYNPRDQVGIDFFHSTQRDMGYVRYTKTLPNRHLLTTGFSYRSPRSAVGGIEEDPAGTAHFAYVLRYPDIPLFADYMEWLTGQYPNLALTFGYDKRLTGGVYDDLQSVQLDLRRLFSFSNYHEISARFLTGFSSGELFRENRFFLGGDGGIRGYSPLRFEGDAISLFSLEYRFPLLYETDVNLFGLALTHTLQGAVFSDLGAVVDGRADVALSTLRSDIGLGVRWFADSFGILPVIFRFDVAWPIDSPIVEEEKAHYYLSAGQPF